MVTEDLEARLQRTLEVFYRLEGVPPVEPFRVQEEFFAALGVKAGEDREALLIHHDGECTNLALFLSRSVRAQASSFLAALHRGEVDDLDGFCAALEGVSHFVYFTFAGGGERPVSRLELELQAEIDKFLLLRSVVGLDGEELLDRLFARFRLVDGLPPDARERYLVASSAAHRYARWAHRALESGQGERAMADARRLYRMPAADKLSHIAKAA